MRESPAIPWPTGAAAAPLPQAPAPSDLRWLYAALLVGGLTLLGVQFSFLTRYQWYSASFSARVSFVYVTLASFLILVTGWSPRSFPIAAALFFGYLPLAQAASETFFLAGNVEGGITLEMILAIPLILTGLLGPAAVATPIRPLPMMVRYGFLLIPLVGVLATALARYPEVAVWTLFGRFIVPPLVLLALYRRLRNVEDAKVIFYGFVVGMLAIMVFGYQRAIEGEAVTTEYTLQVGQRHLGLSVSSAVPALYMMGVSLWQSRARAEKGDVLRSAAWLVAGSIIPLLIWVGGHRAPAAFALLILLLWVPGSLGSVLSKPWALLVLAAGIAVAVVFGRYSLETTTLDVGLIFERFTELRTEGIAGHNRMEIWTAGLDGWLTSPIWGVGLNNSVILIPAYANLHASALGVLYDTGLLGALVFGGFFVAVLRLGGKRCSRLLDRTDRQFFVGHRVAWVILQIMLFVDLPFTSGQPKNNILTYLVLWFPCLAMIVYTRPAGSAGSMPEIARPAEPRA